MPYVTQEAPAEMFMRHNGVGIYHTYKYDDMATNPPRDYWFVTDPYQGEDDAFDVRDLPGYDAPVGSAHLRWYLQDFLASLIESGVITADGVKEVTR
jgi:hypothetical protein